MKNIDCKNVNNVNHLLKNNIDIGNIKSPISILYVYKHLSNTNFYIIADDKKMLSKEEKAYWEIIIKQLDEITRLLKESNDKYDKENN